MPQIAAVWDPAQVPQLALKLQRDWDNFWEAITSPQPNSCSGESCSGSEQGVTLHLGVRELLSELWSPGPGLMGHRGAAALGMSCCLSQWTLSGEGSTGAHGFQHK